MIDGLSQQGVHVSKISSIIIPTGQYPAKQLQSLLSSTPFHSNVEAITASCTMWPCSTHVSFLFAPLLIKIINYIWVCADTAWPATSPNQLASFVRIKTGEAFATEAQATSQVFYVIRSAGLECFLSSDRQPVAVDDICAPAMCHNSLVECNVLLKIYACCFSCTYFASQLQVSTTGKHCYCGRKHM